MAAPNEPIDAKYIRGLLERFRDIFVCHKAIEADGMFDCTDVIPNWIPCPFIREDWPDDSLFHYEGKRGKIRHIWGSSDRYNKWTSLEDRRQRYGRGLMDFRKIMAYELVLDRSVGCLDFVGIFNAAGDKRRLDRWPVYQICTAMIDINFVGSFRKYLREVATCALKVITCPALSGVRGKIWAEVALDAEMMHRTIELSKLLMTELRYLSLEVDATAAGPNLYDFRCKSTLLNMFMCKDLTFVGTK
jgi:hypothetical protein